MGRASSNGHAAKPLRVLAVGTFYPPHALGGYERIWKDAVGRLRDGGHQVKVLCSDWTGTSTGEAEDPDVRRDLQLYVDELLDVRSDDRATVVERELHDAQVLDSVLSGFKPDVVFVGPVFGLPLSLLTKIRDHGLSQLALVADEWPKDAPKADPGQQLLGWTSRLFGRTSREGVEGRRFHYADIDQWVCVSERAADLVRRAGADPSDVTVLRPGPDTRRFERRDPKPWRGELLCAGPVLPKKGIEHAIRALTEAPDCKLTVAGAGDPRYMDELRGMADDLGVEDRLRMLGEQRDRMPELLADADAVIVASVWREAWALVPLEAMAVGRPVVATAVGGAAEYLRDDENSIVVRPGDPAAIARAADRLAKDDELRARLVEGGFATADEYRYDRFLDRLVGALVALGEVPGEKDEEESVSESHEQEPAVESETGPAEEPAEREPEAVGAVAPAQGRFPGVQGQQIGGSRPEPAEEAEAKPEFESEAEASAPEPETATPQATPERETPEPETAEPAEPAEVAEPAEAAEPEDEAKEPSTEEAMVWAVTEPESEAKEPEAEEPAPEAEQPETEAKAPEPEAEEEQPEPEPAPEPEAKEPERVAGDPEPEAEEPEPEAKEPEPEAEPAPGANGAGLEADAPEPAPEPTGPPQLSVVAADAEDAPDAEAWLPAGYEAPESEPEREPSPTETTEWAAVTPAPAEDEPAEEPAPAIGSIGPPPPDVTGVASRIAALEARIAELSSSAIAGIERNASELATLEGRVGELANSAVSGVERNASQLTAAERRVGELATSAVARVERTTSDLASLEQRVTEIAESAVSGVERNAAQLATIDTRLGELAATAATAREHQGSELGSLQTRVGELAAFAELRGEALGQRIDEIERTFQEAVKRLEAIDQRLSTLDGRLEGVEAAAESLADLPERLDRVEAVATEMWQREEIAAEQQRAASQAVEKLEGLEKLNQASFEQLRSLGLSGTQAARLLAAREARSGFESVDELESIPGFPPALITELKQLVES